MRHIGVLIIMLALLWPPLAAPVAAQSAPSLPTYQQIYQGLLAASSPGAAGLTLPPGGYRIDCLIGNSGDSVEINGVEYDCLDNLGAERYFIASNQPLSFVWIDDGLPLGAPFLTIAQWDIPGSCSRSFVTQPSTRSIGDGYVISWGGNIRLDGYRLVNTRWTQITGGSYSVTSPVVDILAECAGPPPGATSTATATATSTATSTATATNAPTTPAVTCPYAPPANGNYQLVAALSKVEQRGGNGGSGTTVDLTYELTAPGGYILQMSGGTHNQQYFAWRVNSLSFADAVVPTASLNHYSIPHSSGTFRFRRFVFDPSGLPSQTYQICLWERVPYTINLVPDVTSPVCPAITDPFYRVWSGSFEIDNVPDPLPRPDHDNVQIELGGATRYGIWVAGFSGFRRYFEASTNGLAFSAATLNTLSAGGSYNLLRFRAWIDGANYGAITWDNQIVQFCVVAIYNSATATTAPTTAPTNTPQPTATPTTTPTTTPTGTPTAPAGCEYLNLPSSGGQYNGTGQKFIGNNMPNVGQITLRIDSTAISQTLFLNLNDSFSSGGGSGLIQAPFVVSRVSGATAPISLLICDRAAATATSTATSAPPALPCPVAIPAGVPVAPDNIEIRLTAGVQFVVDRAAIWINIGSDAREIRPGTYTWDQDTDDYTIYSLTSPAVLWRCVPAPPTSEIIFLSPTPANLADEVCIPAATAPPALIGQIPQLVLVIPTVAIPTSTATGTATGTTTATIGYISTLVAIAVDPLSTSVSWTESMIASDGIVGSIEPVTIIQPAIDVLSWLTLLNAIGPLQVFFPIVIITVFVRMIKPIISLVKYLKQILPFQ